MTQQEQIKALAELDGYVWSRDEQGCWAWHNRVTGHYICKTLFAAEFEEPDYEGWIDFRDYRSYDAIIPLIQKQDIIIGKHFMQQLHKHVSGSGDHYIKDFYCMCATPSQLAEALLRATNKWIEE